MEQYPTVDVCTSLTRTKAYLGHSIEAGLLNALVFTVLNTQTRDPMVLTGIHSLFWIMKSKFTI